MNPRARGRRGGWLRASRISVKRAAAALTVLSHAKLVQAEEFAMNFSGEPHYRCIAAGARRKARADKLG